jgi:hypothetical protein
LILKSSSPARKRRRRSRSAGALHDASASFEPSIDYVVTKIPRFAFEKFPQTDPMLTMQTKSVGEAIAIGRRFKERMQDLICSEATCFAKKQRQAVAIRPLFYREAFAAAPRMRFTPRMKLTPFRWLTLGCGIVFRVPAWAAGPTPIPLWPDRAPGETNVVSTKRDTSKPGAGLAAGKPVIRLDNVTQPSSTMHRPAAGQDTGAAVVVCPGGGYSVFAPPLVAAFRAFLSNAQPGG